MLNLALLSIVTLFLTPSYSADKTQKIPIVEGYGKFFTNSGPTLMTFLRPSSDEEFGDLSSESGKNIREVPVTVLAAAGIHEGDEITYVDLSNRKVRSYKIGKKVFVKLFKSGPGDSDTKVWGKFNLILSNDPKLHNKLAPIDIMAADGFSYIGKKIDFKKLNFNQVPIQNDNEKYTSIDSAKFFKSAKTSGSKVLFSYADKNLKSVDATFLLNQKSFYFVGGLSPVVFDRANMLIPRLPGSDILVASDDGNTDVIDCLSLIFIEKERVFKVPVTCSGEWNFK